MAEYAIDYTKVGRLHPDFHPPVRHLHLLTDFVPSLNKKKLTGPAEIIDLRLERLRRLHLSQCLEDFGAFLEYCFVDTETREPFEVQWFHEEWIQAFKDHQNTMIIAPRSHGKTAIIVAYMVWRLGKDPNLRIKIAAETDKTARKRLSEVKDHIERNKRVHEVFPHLKPGRKWDQGMIEVRRSIIDKEPSIEAVGVLTGCTGSRADLLIADDVVGRRNSLTIPANREKVTQAWEDDWLNMVDDTSQIIYICTLWHRDDNSHKMMKTGAYHTLFYAIPDDFGSMWPGRWSERALRLKRKKLSSAAWARGYKNQPQDEKTKPIQEAWIEFANLRELGLDPKALTWVVSYDLATKLKESNDYYASVVFAVDKFNRKVYVVDAWHARLRPAQQEKMVYKEYIRYEPWRIFMEIVGQANLDMRCEERWPELGRIIEPVNPTGQGSKYERLMNVTPMVENGQVIFSHKLDPEWEGFDHSRGSLYNELVDFPLADHDDMTDAFSQGLSKIIFYLLDRWSDSDDNEMNIEVLDTGGII